MGFDDYKVVLYRNQPDGWVAEIPAIPGCHALMPTREGALVELAAVFRLISEEYKETGQEQAIDSEWRSMGRQRFEAAYSAEDAVYEQSDR